MSNPPRPPAHLEPYVRILGVEGAVRFLLAYGGSELYIPRAPKAGHPLVDLLGLDAAAALGAAADRLAKRVPTGKPWLARVKAAEGLRVSEIARILHTSDVSVRKWLTAGPVMRPGDDRQLPLI